MLRVDVNGMLCCGMKEINSYGLLRSSRKSWEEWYKSYNNYSGYHKGGYLILASATQNQKPYHNWLKKVGFKRHRIFKNPNSGNTVTLYTYHNSRLGRS